MSAAAAGFRVAPAEEFPRIVEALFRIAHKLICLQQNEVIRLLEEHRMLADGVAPQIASNLMAQGQQVNWLSPTWRILWHLGHVATKSDGQEGS